MASLPVSQGVSKRAQWFLGVSACFALLFVWLPLQKLLWQFLFALLLTAVALPISRRMEKRLNRALSAFFTVVLLVLFVLFFIGMLVPPLISQITLVVSEAPQLYTWLLDVWDQFRQTEIFRLLDLEGLSPASWLSAAAKWAADSLPGMISGIGAGIDTLSRAFLSPVLAYYFVRDRETFSYQLSMWVPAKHRKRILTALQEMRREAGGYVRGQLLVALVVAVLTSLGLLIVGVPAWLALGLLMGICEWIPYIGPLIGGVPIALFSLPMGISSLLWALGVTILVQQIEGYVLSPRLMAGATGLHPVYVLVLLSAGGLLWGLPGMVAAVPAFVCIRGAVRVLYETRK